MFVIAFPAQAFGTNCYVVAPAAGEECLIIDPGIGVVERLREVLDTHRLRPAAVLATHGHLDHTFSVTPVCRAHGVAVQIHEDDRYRLIDPRSQMEAGTLLMLERTFGSLDSWAEPDDVITLTDRATVSMAGLELEVLHAPGHTEGSVIFRTPGLPDAMGLGSGLDHTLFTGDVLFAGSIGRTDLAGGDDAAMAATLRDVVLTQKDTGLVLPGHGGASTIGRERAANPYLQGLGS